MPDVDTPLAHKRAETVELIADEEEAIVEDVERRPWPVKALTILLAIQGVGLLALGVYNVEDMTDLMAILQQEYFYVTLPFLGLLALLASLGFLTLRPGARVIALLVQSLTLLVSVIYYFEHQPDSYVLFALMFFSIVIVIYLNFAGVPAAFNAQPGLEAEKMEVSGS